MSWQEQRDNNRLKRHIGDIDDGKALRGRTALVTGGSRGIGAAISRALAEAGAAVAINYRERTDEEKKLAEDIRKTGVDTITVQADVSLAAAVSKMVDTAKSELGTIDILINNAGIAITRGIDDLSETDFDRTIATNLKSVFLCTQAVLPMMRAKNGGGSSICPEGRLVELARSDRTTMHRRQALRDWGTRLAWSRKGSQSTLSRPSLIETEISPIPLGRFGKADEVARAVMMLVDNPYMTGRAPRTTSQAPNKKGRCLSIMQKVDFENSSLTS